MPNLKRAFLGMLASASAVSGEAQEVPQPFTGTYTIEWRGMTAGTATLELVRLSGNDYLYRSSNVARGLFRIAFPDAITQISHFSIVNGTVKPSAYHGDDGSSSKDRDVDLSFDWKAMRVTGTAERKPVDQPLNPGTQDSLSVQIALMCELAAGRSPERFWLINKDEVNDYEYTREGNATLNTPLGKVETIVYRSQHPGSTRVTRLWFAPSLGYLPVRAQQLKRGKPEFTLSIRALKRA